MRVWIVNPFDNLPGEGFRAGRYELMARAFAAAGHEVTWFSADFSHALKRPRQVDSPRGYALRLLAVPPYRQNVSLRRVRSHYAFARAFTAAAAATPLGERPEVVIASTPPLSAANAAFRFCRTVGAKFVLDVQDLWPETFYRLLPRPLRFLGPIVFFRQVRKARRLYREAALVTGTARSYAALVPQAYHYAPLGIEKVEPAAGVGRAGSRTLRLVYLGNLGRSYDLKTVIAAVQAMEGVSLDIAGAAAPRTEGRVTYHGYLQERELSALLATAQIGVVPMTADSFVGIPNKVADYARAGLKIVSSLEGECAELLARTGTGVTYRPGEVASLKAAIRAAARLTGNNEALLRELDAARIYGDYVHCVTKL